MQQDKQFIHSIVALTQRSAFIKTSNCLICVFLDKSDAFDYTKAYQFIGDLYGELVTNRNVARYRILLDRRDARQTIRSKRLVKSKQRPLRLNGCVSLGCPLRNSKHHANLCPSAYRHISKIRP